MQCFDSQYLSTQENYDILIRKYALERVPRYFHDLSFCLRSQLEPFPWTRKTRDSPAGPGSGEPNYGQRNWWNGRFLIFAHIQQFFSPRCRRTTCILRKGLRHRVQRHSSGALDPRRKLSRTHICFVPLFLWSGVCVPMFPT